ncbi:glutamine--fructose-6-phosphate transaminase (isomerizing) [Candidatus Cyanaurora vandensis]|uniref:glutamine--fructose-6-phosphate transaminase (isomerizing) n=1 Tax=Candidatus Cyanaurora vandensis TaxID=2714958 RepID=UPI0025811624|nr:glutamine--fructose-6-phosphate transaminase (isomerizing) [Candidatus Cyanaurora vandensis]
MCGIVGYVGWQAATPILVAGLRTLEYRGYDSAGIATIDGQGLQLVRAKGKLRFLEEKLATQSAPATVGIGHTRWATHGRPEEHNAHPHTDTHHRVAVVQNGIIENYVELRYQLKDQGYIFRSQTDTEVIPYLIEEALKTGSVSLLAAVQQAVNQLAGAFALVIVSADHPDELIAVRQQAPLVLGLGEEENFCSSDAIALVAHTPRILTLKNGEIARLTPSGIELQTFAGKTLHRTPQVLTWNQTQVEKQGFRHFMLKEIHEQPGVIRAALERHLLQDQVDLPLAPDFLIDIERVQIVACGTSWHAGLVGKFVFEELANLPTEVNYASEFRYAPPPLDGRTLVIGVTQSGETQDTLSALEVAVAKGAKLLGITNRPESRLGHLIEELGPRGALLDTGAGIEIGVAATKTFSAQLMTFYLLALYFAAERQPDYAQGPLIQALRQLPAQLELILDSQLTWISERAQELSHLRDFIYIGRGINYPIALEGALKLKEISYIHAEGYPAGEMKHGPIALLDANCPVVAVAMPGRVYEKVLSNAQEAKARDALLIGVTPRTPLAEETFDILLPVPVVHELLSPLVTVVPLQLFAYALAAHRGLDVDQPRNLAKSVTVE